MPIHSVERTLYQPERHAMVILPFCTEDCCSGNSILITETFVGLIYNSV